MNTSVFGKTMENIGKHRSIRIGIINERTHDLIFESKYYSTKWFIDTLLEIVKRQNYNVRKLQVKLIFANFGLIISKKTMGRRKVLLHPYWQFLYVHQNVNFFQDVAKYEKKGLAPQIIKSKDL